MVVETGGGRGWRRWRPVVVETGVGGDQCGGGGGGDRRWWRPVVVKTNVVEVVATNGGGDWWWCNMGLLDWQRFSTGNGERTPGL